MPATTSKDCHIRRRSCVYSWTDDHSESDNDKQGVHAQIVDPRQKAISLNGTGQADQYIGTQFNYTLDGGAGAETMTGAVGNDTFNVDNALDQVIELSSQGTNTFISSGSYRFDLTDQVRC